MALLANISIDVTKIDKNKLIKGKKGTYLNLTVSVNDEEDQFGNNVSVWVAQSKEEREAGNPKVYLGNGKKFWENTPQEKPQPQPQDYENVEDESDDLPW